MRRRVILAFNVKIPNLTGDYKKDMILFKNYMQEVNLKVRLLEDSLKKEIERNGREKGI